MKPDNINSLNEDKILDGFQEKARLHTPTQTVVAQMDVKLKPQASPRIGSEPSNLPLASDEMHRRSRLNLEFGTQCAIVRMLK